VDEKDVGAKRENNFKINLSVIRWEVGAGVFLFRLKIDSGFLSTR